MASRSPVEQPVVQAFEGLRLQSHENEKRNAPIINPKEKVTWKTLPPEIRQKIISYVLDDSYKNVGDLKLWVARRAATPLFQVSKSFARDTNKLEHLWRRTIRLDRDVNDLWTEEDHERFNHINDRLEQLEISSLPWLGTLRNSVSMIRAREHEMKHRLDMLQRANDLKADIIRELREDNDRLTGLNQMTAMDDRVEELTEENELLRAKMAARSGED